MYDSMYIMDIYRLATRLSYVLFYSINMSFSNWNSIIYIQL